MVLYILTQMTYRYISEYGIQTNYYSQSTNVVISIDEKIKSVGARFPNRPHSPGGYIALLDLQTSEVVEFRSVIITIKFFATRKFLCDSIQN